MFVKIFQQIHDSSVANDYLLRLVFMDFLIMADRDGIVNKTQEAIARRTNVPLEIVNAQIDKLCSPDPDSNTPDHEGRRLLPLSPDKSWGWVIVNYRLYRNIKSSDELRAQTRGRVARWREKQKLNGHDPLTAPEAIEENKKTKAVFVPPEEAEILLQCAKIGLPDIEGRKFFSYYDENGWKNKAGPVKDWHKRLNRWKLEWESRGRPISSELKPKPRGHIP